MMSLLWKIHEDGHRTAETDDGWLFVVKPRPGTRFWTASGSRSDGTPAALLYNPHESMDSAQTACQFFHLGRRDATRYEDALARAWSTLVGILEDVPEARWRFELELLTEEVGEFVHGEAPAGD